MGAFTTDTAADFKIVADPLVTSVPPVSEPSVPVLLIVIEPCTVHVPVANVTEPADQVTAPDVVNRFDSVTLPLIVNADDTCVVAALQVPALQVNALVSMSTPPAPVSTDVAPDCEPPDEICSL